MKDPKVIRELGFGRHHLITLDDSIHFTLYPKNQDKPYERYLLNKKKNGEERDKDLQFE
jgi:hypothetical protein